MWHFGLATCTCSRLDNTFQKEQPFFYFYVSFQISFIKTARLLFCKKIYGNFGTKGTLRSQGQVFATYVTCKIIPIYSLEFQISNYLVLILINAIFTKNNSYRTATNNIYIFFTDFLTTYYWEGQWIVDYKGHMDVCM